MSKVRIKRALISISDKTGLEELAKRLRERIFLLPKNLKLVNIKDII